MKGGGIWLEKQSLEKSLTDDVPFSKTNSRVDTSATKLMCPQGDTTMEQQDFYGITIDICPEHQGAWFDGGELGKLLEQWRSMISETPGDYSAKEIARMVVMRNTPKPPGAIEKIGTFLYELAKTHSRHNRYHNNYDHDGWR